MQISVITDGWADSITFENDTLIFEKGSFTGASDNIVLSIVEGEEIPGNIRLRGVNNNWDDSYGGTLGFHAQEVVTDAGGTPMLNNGMFNLFRQGELLSQPDKTIISFSPSEGSGMHFGEEITLKYELDTEYSGFWGAAADRILDEIADANSDIIKLKLAGIRDEHFTSEAAYAAAISSGDVRVVKATSYDSDMGGFEWDWNPRFRDSSSFLCRYQGNYRWLG